MQRSRIDLEYRQHFECLAGRHNWTAWGPYRPVYPHLAGGGFIASDDPLKPEPFEAYRWRVCECGAAERETYATHERKMFTKQALSDRAGE